MQVRAFQKMVLLQGSAQVSDRRDVLLFHLPIYPAASKLKLQAHSHNLPGVQDSGDDDHCFGLKTCKTQASGMLCKTKKTKKSVFDPLKKQTRLRGIGPRLAVFILLQQGGGGGAYKVKNRYSTRYQMGDTAARKSNS